MFLMPEIFPNAELTLAERTMSEEDYENIVQEVFDFYPKLVMFALNFLLFILNLFKSNCIILRAFL